MPAFKKEGDELLFLLAAAPSTKFEEINFGQKVKRKGGEGTSPRRKPEKNKNASPGNRHPSRDPPAFT